MTKKGQIIRAGDTVFVIKTNANGEPLPGEREQALKVVSIGAAVLPMRLNGQPIGAVVRLEPGLGSNRNSPEMHFKALRKVSPTTTVRLERQRATL